MRMYVGVQLQTASSEDTGRYIERQDDPDPNSDGELLYSKAIM